MDYSAFSLTEEEELLFLLFSAETQLMVSLLMVQILISIKKEQSLMNKGLGLLKIKKTAKRIAENLQRVPEVLYKPSCDLAPTLRFMTP